MIPNSEHTECSDRICIKAGSDIKLITIKYTCPECDKEDKVVIHNPSSLTSNIVASVEKKLEHIWERECIKCHPKFRVGIFARPIEMEIKEVNCVLY